MTNSREHGTGHDAGRNMEGNQGEGNRGAAKAYNDDTTEFAQSGQAKQKATEARKALEGPEGDDLRQAEDIGKSRAKGEDPAIRGS